MLTLAFLFMLFSIFGVVVLVMRPTTEQKIITARLASMRASTSKGTEDGGLLKEEVTDSFGWIEEILNQFSIAKKTQLLILQADSKTTFGALVVTSFGLAFAGCLIAYLFTHSLPVAFGVAAIAAYVPFLTLSFRRTRRIAAFNKALPDAIDMIARSLRAGHSMIAAIGIVSEHAAEPIGSEFGEVFRKQNFGLPIRDALTQLLDRIPSQDLRVVVTGILVQKDTGGNLAEILDRTVRVIRERLRIQGEIKTHTAQGRLTGWILCSLPVVMLILINIINPGYSKVLFDDSFGRALLYTGVGLLIAGALLIRQIINGIEM